MTQQRIDTDARKTHSELLLGSIHKGWSSQKKKSLLMEQLSDNPIWVCIVIWLQWAAIAWVTFLEPVL